MNISLATLKVLKFPLKLLFRKKWRKRTELEEKQRKNVRNFAPTHYSWQKRAGKKLTEKQKGHHRKKRKNNRKFVKKLNNSKV